MVSTQTHFAGQEGWNDCSAELASTIPVSKPRRSQRVVSPFVSGSSSATSLPRKDSASSLTPDGGPPRSRQSSTSSLLQCTNTRSSSISSIGVDQTLPNQKNNDEAQDSEAKIDVSTIIEKIHNVLESSQIPESERLQTRSRLNRTVPSLDHSHLLIIQKVLDLTQNNCQLARETLVKYSLGNVGTSSWALPLRRAIERLPN